MRVYLLSNWFWGGKACKDKPGKIIICTEKNIAHDVYNAETNLTPLYAWEKISSSRGLGETFLPKLNHPYAPPQEKSNGQPHRGWERSGFGILVDVIRQQKNGWRAFIMWWFSRPKFRVLSLKIRRWKTQMERKSSKKCSDSFLWANESFSPWNCVSRNSTLFSSRGSERLACFEPTEAARFLKKREVLSAQGKYVF